MKRLWKYDASLLAFLLIALIYVFVSFLIFSQRTKSDPKWTNLVHDSGIYHMYLPATFIHGDPLFGFLSKGQYNDPEKGVQYWAHHTEQGTWIPKMSMGKALMDVPFFLSADSYVRLTGSHERNGFSQPYRYGVLFSTLFYALFGLYFLRLVLLRFYEPQTVAWTLILLAFATNFYHYSTHESGMTHPHNFFLLSVGMYLSLSWRKQQSVWRALLFGMVCGLIVLVRPINLILLLPLPFFLSLNHGSRMLNEIKKNLNEFVLSKKFLVAVFAGLLVLAPQLVFWKIQSGSWLHYSYNDEGFFFTNPHIWDGLFSFRKGWLIYTPVMVFALMGWFIFSKKRRTLGWVGGISFLLFIYVTFSWWCWWYGGGFSARTMIDIYPLLALGLGAFVAWVMSQNVFMKLGFSALFIVFIGLNFFQTYQYKLSLIHWDSMNFKTYKAIFLKTRFPENYAELISEPDYHKQMTTGEE